MDRDAFIQECVNALQGLVAGNGGNTGDPDAKLYERLTYDFPELSAGDLTRLLVMVYEAIGVQGEGSLRNCDKDAQLSPALQLLLGVTPPTVASRTPAHLPNGTCRDPKSSLETAIDTLKEKAQSSTEDTVLWQQLYGAHLFAMLAASPEEVLDACEGAISCHGLTNDSTWKGRFVIVVKHLLNRVVRENEVPSAGRRREAAFGLLESLVLCTRSPAIATVVFTMLLDVCTSGSAVSTDARVRVARMVGAACCADPSVVSGEVAKRVLFELVGPVLEDLSGVSGRHGGQESAQWSMMVMAGSVCLEHVVYELLSTQRRRAGAREAFEATMIRMGVWRHMVVSMASVEMRADEHVAVRMSLARALVMTSALSDELHGWSTRVPGYAAAWVGSADDDVDTAIVRGAWSTLDSNTSTGAPRHVRFLREVFCAEEPRIVSAPAESAVRTLEVTERLCRALEDPACTYGGDRDILQSIERMRAAVGERIRVAECARPDRRVDDDEVRRLSTLPEVERLRHVDRMLKGLGEVAAGGGAGSRKAD